MDKRTRRDRILGALYGLALGDAVGFPSLFHRFHVLPAKRHDFLFETNKRLSREHVLPLALPFTHRQSEDTLAPAPSDDSEYAAFTALALTSLRDRRPGPGPGPVPATGPGPGEISAADLAGYWRDELLPRREQLWTRFSERAALDNLAAGVEPPSSGDHNPLHYEDAAVSRAVAVGCFRPGDPDGAAALAEAEAQISQSEDGIHGARAMAAAVSSLTGGAGLAEALTRGAAEFPHASWIAREWDKAQACRDRADTVYELAMELADAVINNVYSFGNAAPETVPAAFVLAGMAEGRLMEAVSAANLIAKSADSLPPFVGALCGAAGGASLFSSRWRERLDRLGGICIPSLEGSSLAAIAGLLAGEPAGEGAAQRGG